MAPKQTVGRKWLRIDNVEKGTRQLPAVQRFHQRVGNKLSAAADMDKRRARPKAPEKVAIEESGRVLGQG